MIDKTPAKGRYILLESMFTDGPVGPCGLITKTAKSRVYYIPVSDARGEKIEDAVEKHAYNFVYVCDTFEEALVLQKHSWDSVLKVMELRESRKNSFADLVTSLSKEV